jgi:hypothetical protein
MWLLASLLLLTAAAISTAAAGKLPQLEGDNIPRKPYYLQYWVEKSHFFGD